MQALISMAQDQTMSSKELVEVINAIRKEEGNDTEIQHSDLVKRIKGFASILGEGSVSVAEYLDVQGKPRPMLLLSKRASMLAVSAESPRINLAIIDRWQELEAQSRPLTYLEALKELVAKEEEHQRMLVEDLRKTQIIQHKQAITNDGDTYFTIARVKELNQGMKLSGQLLNRESIDQELPAIKQNSMYGVNTPLSYHREVWEAVYPDIVLP